ncbi:MAG: SRPBCC domain-containing protein [Chloroflexi bacterium]|nr:SRPBCC domain-containing protein [Chloroflexota bacterium]
MKTKTEFSAPSATDIQFVRRFAADRSRLWALWTQAEHLRNWWGPKGFTTPVCEVDFKPGGVWFYCMQDAAGQHYCGKMTYDEIDPPHRFSATDVFTDEAGNLNPDLPAAHTEIAFAEVNGETVVTGFSRYRSQSERDQIIEMEVEAGLSQTLDRLDEYLQSLME